jgi:hypothetical protein
MTEFRLPSRAGWAIYRFTAFLAGVALRQNSSKNKKPTYQVTFWRWVLGRLLLQLVTFYRP